MKQQQLELNLAPQIRELHLDAMRIAGIAKEHAVLAVEKAIECGNLLLQQKATLNGNSWVEWLANNLRDIPYETLSGYTRAAKLPSLTAPATPMKELSDGTPTSTRQVLLTLGIIPPLPTRTSTSDPSKGWVRYVRFIDGFRRWFNLRVEEEPLEKWDEQARRVLKRELEWIVALHAKL